jgi:gamma-glutamyltranspeptidase/glutathione hydrolase
VPGSVAGLYEAHQKHGKMPWDSLVIPAVGMAAKGILVTEAEAQSYNRYKKQFKQLNPFKNAFVKTKPWKAGDTLIQTTLANTLLRIQQDGAAGFYSGPTANRIAAQSKAGKGIISLDDLKNYSAKWRKPVVFPYKNYTIISMPPPSSGGLCLAELFNMIEPYPLKKWGYKSAKSVHLMVEAERRAYADRSVHLGDSDFYPVPIDSLTSKAYAMRRMSNFDSTISTRSAKIQAGVLAKAESEETTHYAIVDKEGNAVSVTTTINSNYGSKVIVEGGGFFLNNEMDDFSAKPGQPNQFGLIGNEANAIAPGKRMLSSMTPTIVEKDGVLFMVVGTPGGSTIITSVFQVICNVIEFELPLLEAVHNTRFHHQWRPDTIFYEQNGLSLPTIDSLRSMGHTLVRRSNIGRVEAILRTSKGRLHGVADRRGDDSAAGF